MLIKINYVENRYVKGSGGQDFADVSCLAFINPNAITAVESGEISAVTYMYIRVTGGEMDASYRVTLDEWQRIAPLLVMPAQTEIAPAPARQESINTLSDNGKAWNIQRAIDAITKALEAEPFIDPVTKYVDLYELVKDLRNWPLPGSVLKAWNKADITCTVSKDMDAFDFATSDLFQALGRVLAPERFPIDGDYHPRPLSEAAKALYLLFFEVDDARDAWTLITDEDESDEDTEYQALEAYKDALRTALDAVRPYLDDIVAHLEGRTLESTRAKFEADLAETQRRQRLSALWAAKTEAYDAYQQADDTDYDALDRYAHAAAAYADAAAGYIARTPLSIPLDHTTTESES